MMDSSLTATGRTLKRLLRKGGIARFVLRCSNLAMSLAGERPGAEHKSRSTRVLYTASLGSFSSHGSGPKGGRGIKIRTRLNVPLPGLPCAC